VILASLAWLRQSANVQSGVGAAAVEEAEFLAATVLVKSDDLSLVVDALGDAVGAAWGIDCRVSIGRHPPTSSCKGTILAVEATPAGLVLEIEIAERLSGGVADDKAARGIMEARPNVCTQ
jgi:hypothetical protein